jgi:hypothetical protein
MIQTRLFPGTAKSGGSLEPRYDRGSKVSMSLHVWAAPPIDCMTYRDGKNPSVTPGGAGCGDLVEEASDGEIR